MASHFPNTKRLKMDEQDRTFIPSQLDGPIHDIPDPALRQIASYLPCVTRAVFATVMAVRSAEPSVFLSRIAEQGFMVRLEEGTKEFVIMGGDEQTSQLARSEWETLDFLEDM